MLPFYETSAGDLRVFHSDNLLFPSHFHEQLELLYVLEGSITVTIHNQSSILNRGDFAIIFPNLIHSYESYDNTKSPSCRVLLSICGLNLTGSFLNSVKKYQPQKPFLKAAQLHSNIPFAMKELSNEQGSEQSIAVYSALTQLILARLLPHIGLLKNKDMAGSDLTYQIASYISEHFQEPITLSALARQLNVSKYYLSRIFSGKLNTGFNQYLNNMRLHYAATLIRSTDLSITQICMDSGFDSQRTFHRVFRELFHMTPVKYRLLGHDETLHG